MLTLGRLPRIYQELFICIVDPRDDVSGLKKMATVLPGLSDYIPESFC